MNRETLESLVSEGEVLREQDLSGASLEGARVGGGVFIQCSLRGARMAGLWAREALFVECDLSGADLTGADLSHAQLQGCAMEGATLRDADLTDTNLIGCAWRQVDASGVTMRATMFVRGAVEGVSLANAAWGEKRPMLSVDRFEAKLQLWPLITSSRSFAWFSHAP